jgi:IS30 family transposase
VIVVAGSLKAPRERVRVFWRARVAGASMLEAAGLAGVSVPGAARWVAESGGMIPDLDGPSGRYLSLAEREEIAHGWSAGQTRAEIARQLGRHRATIGRELVRNRTVRYPQRPPLPDGRRHRPGRTPGDRSPRHNQQPRYRAALAQSKAEARARRPKPGKLASNPELCAQVQARLLTRLSPEQITATLRAQFPSRPEMWVSHETIYQALYVQGRGELRRELARCLRTGRALRKPRRVPGDQRGKRSIPTELMISARPAEVTDRAVPGHWES